MSYHAGLGRGDTVGGGAPDRLRVTSGGGGAPPAVMPFGSSTGLVPAAVSGMPFA